MVVAAVRRTRELSCNVGLALSTVRRHQGDDPLSFGLLVLQRLPRRLVAGLARLLGGIGDRPHDLEHPTVDRRGRGGLRMAYGAWLGGRRHEAVRELRALSPDGSPIRRRLYAELALQLGQIDLLQASVSSSLQARAAWQCGDVHDALEHASRDRRHRLLHHRLLDEVALLRPGRRLDANQTQPHGVERHQGEPQEGEPSHRGEPHGGQVHRVDPHRVEQHRVEQHRVEQHRVADHGDLAAFHVLASSLPYTESGYTIRNHAVLRAQRAVGIRVAAATRIGYPVSLGVLTARHLDVIDEIPYLRPIPAWSAPTPAARLRQEAELLLPAIDRFEPSVLHTTTHYPNALVTQELARQLGVPWVYEVRGLLEESWVAGRSTGDEQEHAAASERYRLLRAKETELALAADAVVTLSETLRDELLARGVPAERITVVPNAVDPALLEPLPWDPVPQAPPAAGLQPEGLRPEGLQLDGLQLERLQLEGLQPGAQREPASPGPGGPGTGPRHDLPPFGLERRRGTGVRPGGAPDRRRPPRIVRTSPEAREVLGLPTAGFWVGTVSSLVELEGFDSLIDAVAELRRRGIDAHALLVGDGVARPALEEQARRTGVADRVTFVGRVRHDRVPLYYRALDAFAIPRQDLRLCRRVTPLKPIEAMACGLPVVASNLPALAELVRGPGTGMLVPPDDPVALADALELLEAEPELRARYGVAGRTFAATRTWSRAGESYRALFGRLAEAGPR